MKNHPKNYRDYLILVTVLGFLVSLLFILPQSQLTTRLLIFFVSLNYFVWGMYHHHREGTLSREIVFEYLAFSALGLLLVEGLTV